MGAGIFLEVGRHMICSKETEDYVFGVKLERNVGELGDRR
jgi:hypothetical protein